MSIEELITSSLSKYDSYYALKNAKSSKILIQKYNGKEIGFAELKKYKNIGAIFYVGILPEYRGKGFGKELIKKAEEIFKRKNVDIIVASTKSDNIAAIKLFKSLDYTIFNKKYVKNKIIELLDAYEDDTIVCKELNENIECGKIIFK
ncbi:GNAT family N-acetyltransferase [Sulfurisphaera ohwakuensis]|uniref:GNAT family N-acetyltransferase n=1 Tax=Sulfurisphaera ohwakuensis TaxID=69656 RepID=A0A650CDG5_SULOH|nr:GNAT family N-acetyltransferase [Sulfurisphaera ohwakuensis]MBB5253197.1 ribosomal protein S18 acetylase RimI-like enzyme [Sulfurisphaera ohwakuensis]QGR15893.1 GNAT family N-acetyltransferase [Sulfurisphaera ohwakuensis]